MRSRRVALPERVGQLLWIGFEGSTLTAELLELLREIRPGGLILFARNIESAPQVGALNRALLRTLDPPPFIAVDQEGGRVSRLRGLLGPTPAAFALGRRPDAARAVARFAAATARALRSLGFNVNFAPVLDLSEPGLPNGIGDRAFSADPGRVAALARVFAREHLRCSVLPVGKHFPGLGGARADTHEILPAIETPRTDLWRRDLLPYRRLRRALPMLMAGHAFYPTLQKNGPSPASLSRAVVGDLLRRRLGYRGLLLTDDLEMGAVDQTLDGGEQALRAFDAGGDGLMFCRTRERIREAHARLRQAAASRELDPRRLEASLRRIEALKRRHLGGRPAGSGRADALERAMVRARAAIAALGMDEARGLDPTART